MRLKYFFVALLATGCSAGNDVYIDRAIESTDGCTIAFCTHDAGRVWSVNDLEFSDCGVAPFEIAPSGQFVFSTAPNKKCTIRICKVSGPSRGYLDISLPEYLPKHENWQIDSIHCNDTKILVKCRAEENQSRDPVILELKGELGQSVRIAEKNSFDEMNEARIVKSRSGLFRGVSATIYSSTCNIKLIQTQPPKEKREIIRISRNESETPLLSEGYASQWSRLAASAGLQYP